MAFGTGTPPLGSTPTSELVIDTGVATAVDEPGGQAAGAQRDAAVFGVIVHLDFGGSAEDGEADMARTTVTGCPWVEADTAFCPTLFGRAADDAAEGGAGEEDILLMDSRLRVCGVVPGVGFDVLMHVPEGTFGTFVVHVIGVQR